MKRIAKKVVGYALPGDFKLDQTKLETAELLIEFLNGPSDGVTGRVEVFKVFEMLKQLDELRRKQSKVFEVLKQIGVLEREQVADIENHLPPLTAADRETMKRFRSLLRGINAILGRFHFTPKLEIRDPLARVWWLPDGELLSATIAGYLKIMLNILEDGWIVRFRQCFCGRWFFAHTNKKAVCSDACRFQKFKQGKDTFNKERAEYMRKYRSNPRVKARKEANGKTRK